IKCKVVYDIADWYAESRKVGRLKKLIEKLERLACKRADAVIVAHEERVKQIGFVPRRFTVIYNSPCVEASYESEIGGEIFNETNYFAYVGVLHKDRGIDKIVNAALKLGVKVVLAGFGPLEDYCRQMSQRYDNIDFLGVVPYEKTLSIEKNALGILALYDPELPNNKLAAPNKLFESMLLGTPIITNRQTLVGKIVEQEKIGVVIDYNSQEELVKAMELLIREAEVRISLGNRARKLYDLKYSCARQCERLQELYRDLLQNS
ncbi:MAG: glycosyltransferase, partial [Fervidobacterium sp.]